MLTSEDRRLRAVRLLKHYINLCRPELKDNLDCQAEIEEIVDCIVEAAVARIKEEVQVAAR